jgi:DNA-binding GntR family transcriptional regulator
MNSFATPRHSRDTLTAVPFSRAQYEKPSVDDVYPRVFEAILEQRIAPTSRFTEDSLGQMFGISRSIMRGVLEKLSHQQVIILRTHHRPRVAAPDAEQTRQTLHARRLTEITLVRLACQQPQANDVQRLRELVKRQRQCLERDQRGPAIRLAGEFHLALAYMAGNAPLAHFLGSLVPLTSLAIAQFDAPVEDCCGWQVHEAIVDAVDCGDALKAETLLNQHLDFLEERLLNAGQVLNQNRIAG